MKKVKFTLNIGFPLAHRETVVEFDDDATLDEIEQHYLGWCVGFMECGWEVID